MEDSEKLGQKQVSNVTLRFVWGHLLRKQAVSKTVERAAMVVDALVLKVSMKFIHPKWCGQFMFIGFPF